MTQLGNVSTRVLARYFDELLQLRVIIEQGSLSRAASEVLLTQSALTRSVARLETALGIKLLIRTGRGVSPTPYAEALLSHIHNLEVELRSADNTIQTLRTSSNSLIRCGATRTTLMHIIPYAINELQRTHPTIHVRLREASPELLASSLRQGDYDVVVSAKYAIAPEENLTEEYLTSEPCGIYLRADHPVLQGPPPSLNDLVTSQKWVLPVSGEGAHGIVETWFTSLGARLPASSVETQSVQAMRWLVAHTDRLTFTTPGVIADDIRAGTIQRLKVDWQMPSLPILMYLPRQTKQPNMILAFADCIRRAAKIYGKARS